MKPLNNTITGWTAIAAGIATLSLPFAIAVLAAVGSLENIAGALGDVLGAIATVLIIPMLIAIGRIVMTNHGTLGRSLQILGVLGVLSWLIAFFITFSDEPGEVWDTLGRVFVGIAVLIYALLNRTNPGMKTAYVWLSIILGLVMATSFWGLIFQDEINAILQGNTSEANPILLATIFILSPIYLLGWPIWLIWTGRLFLKERLAIPESNEPVPQKV